ncbi:MAG: hypothetical protein ACKV2T_38015 [Kofleriaceae bacterium]
MALLHPHELIPNLGTLDRLLSEKTNDPERMMAIERQTELVPYHLRGAAFALDQLESARIEAVNVLEKYPGILAGAQVVLTTEIDPVAFALDAYLFHARRTLDAVLTYLGRCPANLGLPASMNDLVTGLKKNVSYKLDAELTITILRYWDDVGARLKGYRDQASHRAIILSNCVAFRTPNGASAMRMLLPDDYDETKPSEIGYKPGVPLMAFALSSFGKTVRFVNDLVERMIDLMATEPNSRKSGTVSILMRGGGMSMGGSITGEPVPFPETVSNVAKKATTR